MSRLRNRQVKATFWTDGELLRWHRDKRFAYMTLWAMAEDSACIEDDPFGWKVVGWPSPLDADITVDRLAEWREEWVAEGKAVPYEAPDGKKMLYLPHMAAHERPRNPQSPNLPLPSWVEWVPHASDLRKGSYNHQTESLTRCTTVETATLTVPALPCPVLSCPDLPGEEAGERDEALSNAPKCMAHPLTMDGQRKPGRVWIAEAMAHRWGVPQGNHLPATDRARIWAEVVKHCGECTGSPERAALCVDELDRLIRTSAMSSPKAAAPHLAKFLDLDRRRQQ